MSQEAFESVVSAHHGEIFRYLQRVIGRAGDADDLSQETFLRAYRAYGSLPGEVNLRAWLFAIATNLAKTGHAGFDKVILLATSPAAVSTCQKAMSKSGSSPHRVELMTWLDL